MRDTCSVSIKAGDFPCALLASFKRNQHSGIERESLARHAAFRRRFFFAAFFRAKFQPSSNSASMRARASLVSPGPPYQAQAFFKCGLADRILNHFRNQRRDIALVLLCSEFFEFLLRAGIERNANGLKSLRYGAVLSVSCLGL